MFCAFQTARCNVCTCIQHPVKANVGDVAVCEGEVWVFNLRGVEATADAGSWEWIEICQALQLNLHQEMTMLQALGVKSFYLTKILNNFVPCL